MKKFLSLLVCASAGMTLASCGKDYSKDDAMYMVDAEQEKVALSNITNYTSKMQATYNGQSSSENLYVTENIFKVEQDSTTIIYSCEEDRYFQYQSNGSEWEIKELSPYYFGTNTSQYDFFEYSGIERSTLSEFKFNSKTNMYEHNLEEDGVTYKEALMFKDGSLVKAEISFSGKLYGYEVNCSQTITDFGTTSIDTLPSVKKPETTTPTE